MKSILLLVSTFLAGCANSATGIVLIGENRYMSSRMVHMATSGGGVKAELYREAATFCSQKGKKLNPGPSTSQDAGLASYASAEIQFSCD